MATCVPTRPWLPGGEVAPSRVCPREQATEASKSKQRPERTGGGWGSSKHPPQAEMSRRQSSPRRGIRSHLPSAGRGSILQGSRCQRLRGPETTGQPRPP